MEEGYAGLSKMDVEQSPTWGEVDYTGSLPSRKVQRCLLTGILWIWIDHSLLFAQSFHLDHKHQASLSDTSLTPGFLKASYYPHTRNT